MIIHLDKQPYALDVGKIADRIKQKYNFYDGSNALLLPGGKSIDIGKKSIIRLAIKSMLVPIAIPALQALAQKYAYELTPHVKHEDLIDYFINNTLDLVAALETGINIYVSTQDSDSTFKNIISFSTVKQEYSDTKGEENPEQATNNDEDTRWGNDFCSG